MPDGAVRNANTDPVQGAEALAALDGVDHLYVAKGKKVLHVDLVDARPSDEALLELLLGRSGKLRAPTIRVGSKLLVGYNDEILRTHLL